jgi:hypothetical protein
MPALESIIKELEFLSDRLSSQARAIAIGLLALSWTILVGESTTLRSLADNLRSRLLIVSVLAISALIFDFLQYLFGYVGVNQTRKKAEKARASSMEYSYETLPWRFRIVSFWIKLLLTLAAAVEFIYVLVPYVCFH